MRSAIDPSGRTSSTVSPLLFNRAEASGICHVVPLTMTRVSLLVNLKIDPEASCRLQFAACSILVPVGAVSSIHSSPDSGAGETALNRKSSSGVMVAVDVGVTTVVMTMGVD